MATIQLLAPTTVESASDEGSTVILELSQPGLRALAAAVEVAYDDPVSTPAELENEARDLIEFFRGQAGRV